MFVTVAQAKAHFREFEDFEDALVQQYIDAAEKHVQNYCDRLIYAAGGTPPEGDETAIEIEPPIIEAILLLVAATFDHRSEISDVQTYRVPHGVKNRLAPYRNWCA